MRDGSALLIGLLHDRDQWVGDRVVVVADKHPFGEKDIVLEHNRIGAGHETKSSYLALLPELDTRVVLVVLFHELITECRTDVVHEKAEVGERVEMTTLANGNRVPDGYSARIDDAKRWPDLGAITEVPEHVLLFVRHLLVALEEHVVLSDGTLVQLGCLDLAKCGPLGRDTSV